MKTEADVDCEDETCDLVVDTEGRVPPLHHCVDGCPVEGPDRAKNLNPLDTTLLVDGGFDDNSPLDTVRYGIRRIDGLNPVNELRRSDTGTDTDRFLTGRRRSLPPPDPTLDPKTRT